jgi:hypothetical protein
VQKLSPEQQKMTTFRCSGATAGKVRGSDSAGLTDLIDSGRELITTVAGELRPEVLVIPARSQPEA